jgi:hypothetical protein
MYVGFYIIASGFERKPVREAIFVLLRTSRPVEYRDPPNASVASHHLIWFKKAI